MPEIMNTNIWQIGFDTDSFPESLHLSNRVTLDLAREDPGTIRRKPCSDATE
jgi:hypothetical protein